MVSEVMTTELILKRRKADVTALTELFVTE